MLTIDGVKKGFLYIYWPTPGDPYYILPIKAEDNLIELGGGEIPLIRPNLDIRELPTVDIVADLEEPLPLLSDEYDGVFSKYVLEHIGIRKVVQFISEIYRILKPEGYAVVLTANLLEIARVLVGKNVWDWDLVGMVYSQQDYPENTHKSGFSPEFATRLFKEAGFIKVFTLPMPDSYSHGPEYGAMNMAIIAQKPPKKEEAEK